MAPQLIFPTNNPIFYYLSHNQFNIHHFAEVTDGFHIVTVGEDHVLAAYVLGEFLHGAGVREHFQAGELGSGIVPAELVPCGGRCRR